MLFNSIFILSQFCFFFFLSLSLTKHLVWGFGLFLFVLGVSFIWGFFEGVVFSFYFFILCIFFLQDLALNCNNDLHLTSSTLPQGPLQTFCSSFSIFHPTSPKCCNLNHYTIFQLHHWLKCFIPFMICACCFIISSFYVRCFV